MSDDEAPRLIAFYLPQFHPIPENDAWWGTGFTEWRNVTRARPLYRGHYQPHLPADLGFYDLRVPEVREQQAALAMRYGIYGFCYYYYWFSGRRLLERPLDEVVALGKPDLPFCICWANENWSRRWDGSEDEILLAQEHSPENDERFILDILNILKDPRYIRVAGRPMLLVYRVDLLPRAAETARTWRSIAAANGVPELHLCAVQSFGIDDPRPYGFDAAVEFPPHGLLRGGAEHQLRGLSLGFDGRIEDYRSAMQLALSEPVPDYQRYRGVMVGWDNTPRRMHRAYIFENGSPENYLKWLSALVRPSSASLGSGQFVFINAWNEWAEGAHLEPDVKYGPAYLEATKAALDASARSHSAPLHELIRRTEPLVSVVIPSYNHARFIGEAIASVEQQTYDNIELVVVDDGSTDDSVHVIDTLLSNSRFQRIIVKTQPNLGAAAAIDRGVMLSSGQYVNVLNSDDYFAPGRIRRLVDEATGQEDAFLFSGVAFYCNQAQCAIDCDGPDPRVRWYKDAIRLGAATPTAGFALLGRSLTVSTSNFFFNRALFDKLMGFNNELPQAHDWDFVLRVTRYVEPQLVPDELLTYRYHTRNASWGLLDRHATEGRIALGRFFDFTRAGTLNELAPTRANWPEFFDSFCSKVTPWFASEPLAQYVPPGTSPNGYASADTGTGALWTPAREAAAGRRLDDGLERDRSSATPVAELRLRAVQGWARFQAAPV